MPHYKKSTNKEVKKKRVLWSPVAESFLIDLWEKRISDLRSTRKHSKIYEEMAMELKHRGVAFTAAEIKMKLHNLTNKYKDEKKRIAVSGGSPSEWQFYSKVHGFLGNLKSYNIEKAMEENTGLYAYPSRSETPVKLLRSSTSLERSSIERCETTDSSMASNPSTPLVADSSLQSRLSSSASKRKRNHTSFQQVILESIKESNAIIQLEMKSIANSDKKIVKLQERSLKIETKRNEIIEKILTDSANFQSEVLNLLKENRNQN